VVLAECGREKEGSSLVRSLAATFRLHLHTDQEDKVALAKKHWTHRRDQFVKVYFLQRKQIRK
jgi:hypothetical protein